MEDEGFGSIVKMPNNGNKLVLKKRMEMKMTSVEYKCIYRGVKVKRQNMNSHIRA